jgi:hypothetical protein
MIGKLLEVLQKQNSENTNSSSQFDMDAFRLKAAQTVRTAFRSMDEKSKRELLTWISAVREIKATPGFNYREKESRLHDLGSSATVLKTIKAVLDSAVEQAAPTNQQIIRKGLSGIAISASLMKLPQIPIAMLYFSQALPKFLLTPQFEIVASVLEKELLENLKELQSPA